MEDPKTTILAELPANSYRLPIFYSFWMNDPACQIYRKIITTYYRMLPKAYTFFHLCQKCLLVYQLYSLFSIFLFLSFIPHFEFSFAWTYVKEGRRLLLSIKYY
jgi:hypothetical protein